MLLRAYDLILFHNFPGNGIKKSPFEGGLKTAYSKKIWDRVRLAARILLFVVVNGTSYKPAPAELFLFCFHPGSKLGS
jgi:hypothetical protein